MVGLTTKTVHATCYTHGFSLVLSLCMPPTVPLEDVQSHLLPQLLSHLSNVIKAVSCHT